jgi:protease-4
MAQKKGKPVFVSMGDTAASGGYWIAMNADKIIAESATLTGSIGVVSGKFSAKDLMQKIGVNVETVQTSDNTGMWMPLDRFNDQQRERVNALMDNTYKAFTDNVAAARKIAPEKMPEIAKGRVWTGSQAVSIGLVDQLGGIETALTAIRKNLKLSETDHLFVQTYPPAETTVERIQRLLSRFGVEGAMMGSLFTALHQLQVVFAPWLGAMDATHHVISARMTPMAVH